MIRRLRRKLVLACMLSLLIVLAAIISGMNLLNYRNTVRHADNTLAMLRENGGRFPANEHPRHEKPPRNSGLDSPEFPFITRFFSVGLQDGTLVSMDTDKIAAVDEASAGSYAAKALNRKSSRGFVDNYRFLRYAEEENIRILFLDCERSLANFRSVLLLSTGVSLLGYLAVFMLLGMLSGRIIRPISESYEKQRRFITDAGHELKTPLTIIDADAGILEMERGESEWIDDIRCQTSRLASLTSDLLCLSRMEEQRQVEMVSLPISDLVAETAASFQAPARTRCLALNMDIHPLLSCSGDSRQLCQLVGILMDNALKYSPPGGSIRLTLERQGKSIRLCVENMAESISKETLGNMFDRFYRGDTSRGGNVKGYGIGLSIAKAIVQAHRGKIFAASPDGKTMRITVLLPAER